MPRTSSKAAAAIIVEETLPFALYSWVIARVADGSVGEAKAASNMLIGIKVVAQAEFVACIKNGITISSPTITQIKALSASNSVIYRILLPSFFMREYKSVPPTEKVIKDSEILVTRAVCFITSEGMNFTTSGFSSIPAKIYPVIFGSLIRSASSPKRKPVITIIPTISIGCIKAYLSRLIDLLTAFNIRS